MSNVGMLLSSILGVTHVGMVGIRLTVCGRVKRGPFMPGVKTVKCILWSNKEDDATCGACLAILSNRPAAKWGLGMRKLTGDILMALARSSNPATSTDAQRALTIIAAGNGKVPPGKSGLGNLIDAALDGDFLLAWSVADDDNKRVLMPLLEAYGGIPRQCFLDWLARDEPFTTKPSPFI